MKIYVKDVIALVGIIALILLTFWWVPKGYFQQDEWYYMGQFLLAKTDPFIIFHIYSGMHFFPVTLIWTFFQFFLFWLHPFGYGVFSVVTHILVAILVYVIIRKFSIDVFPAFFGVAFFALNPVSSQVVTWSSASVNGGLSAILFLLGFFGLLTNFKKKSVFIDVFVCLALFCSLLAKEDAIVGFICIFILSFAFETMRRFRIRPLLIPLVLWIFILTYTWIFRMSEAGSLHKTINESVSYMLLIPGWMGNIIITHDTLRAVFQGVFGKYDVYFPFIDNDPLLKTMSMIIAVIFYISLFVITAIKKLPLKKILVFPILVFLSMLPYVFSISTGLESRYYYIPVLITGIWIAVYLNWLRGELHRFIQIAFYTFFIILIGAYWFANQPHSDYLPFQVERATIVSAFQTITPPTSDSVVYYIQNGADFPFQSGVGQMLLVLQASHDIAFASYFKSYFLWGMFEQGYEKIGTKGFGYYFDLNELIGNYKEGLFPLQSIRAYYYDPNSLTLNNITKQVDQKIRESTLVIQ